MLRDKMETFWPAETLKYLYPLLGESQPRLLPLDQSLVPRRDRCT